MYHCLFLLVAFTNKSWQNIVRQVQCNAEFCNPNHEPYPNILSVMTGYNILTGNPFSSTHNDPGFGTSYIFVPTYKTPEDTYALHSGIAVRGLSTCSLSTSSDIITTVNGYTKNVVSKASQGNTFTSNLEREVSAELKGVKGKTTVPPLVDAAFLSSQESKNNEHFLGEKRGVLTLQDATCSAYSIFISRYDPPPFSQAFVNALTNLNKAEETNYQTALDIFIKEFGTHFVHKATLGARIAVTRRYSGDEFRKSTNDQIQNCNEERLKLNFGGVGVGHSSQSCKEISSTAESGSVDGYEREIVTTYGSKPETDLYTWSKQKFNTPMPIKVELSSLLNLFSKTYMKNYPSIDYKRILKWIGPLYYNYCETKKSDLNIETCNPKAKKGCGWSDNCIPRQQVCNNNLHDDGFTCCTPKCLDIPCKNGGKCKDITDISCTFSCTCKIGWEGSTCEIMFVTQDVLKVEIERQMDLHHQQNNKIFLMILELYLKKLFPKYFFSIVVYDELPDNPTYNSGRGTYISLTKHNRHVVVGWSKRNSKFPPVYDFFAIERSITIGDLYSASDCVDKAYNVAKSFGYPVVFALVVRIPNVINSLITDQVTPFDFRTTSFLFSKNTIYKEFEHLRLVLMFGNP